MPPCPDVASALICQQGKWQHLSLCIFFIFISKKKLVLWFFKQTAKHTSNSFCFTGFFSYYINIYTYHIHVCLYITIPFNDILYAWQTILECILSPSFPSWNCFFGADEVEQKLLEKHHFKNTSGIPKQRWLNYCWEVTKINAKLICYTSLT